MKPFTRLSALTLLLSCAFSQAQTPPAAPADALKQAAQKALDSNPEVGMRLNAFRAATHEARAVKGGLFPRVDLSALASYDRQDNRLARAPWSSLETQSATLSVTQLLWDGKTTLRELDRAGHARLTRYFEFRDAAETMVLEVARAYLDVQRYRRLVTLAEDNYVQHKTISEQIAAKTRAGAQASSDLDQATARLALADSNLTTEIANLHDVSARYQRLVGESPARQLPEVTNLNQGLTGSAPESMREALATNAAISATIENVRSVQDQARGIDGAFQPRVQAAVKGTAGHNVNGTTGLQKDGRAEISMSWNLYNGGTDSARVRQFSQLINQAYDLRDKTCRDVRQTTAIAFNDTQKLADQVRLLSQNFQSIEKARLAYRDQFTSGRRTLLDVLNSENEVYTAHRALVNAQFDLEVAYARTQAASNRLLPLLGLSNPVGEDPVQAWSARGAEAERCPVEPVVSDVYASRAELDARAMRELKPAASTVQALPAPTPALSQSQTVAAKGARMAIDDWVASWMAKDFGRYMAFYSDEFKAAKSNYEAWKAQRKLRVTKKGPIVIRVGEVQYEHLGEDLVKTTFSQNYKSQDFADQSVKVLTWRKIKGDWKIVAESNR